MDLPVSDLGPVKDSNPSFHCTHCDSEVVHKIAQLLLPGLATACVDSTTGDLFRSPATVAVDLRREFVDFLTLRSETLVTETLLRAADPAVVADPDPDAISLDDDPADIVSDLMEEFAASKRNLLSRVSGWILSDSRDDKIDDFVQEMEMNGFWLVDRRESVAETLLKNLDYKKLYHCSMKFENDSELEGHKKECSFRPVGCPNDGCKVKFSAIHGEKHDSVCPYKLLPCEQTCEQRLLRIEMDRHCITVCPMKMVNCPFYQVGCQSAFPLRGLEDHCREFVRMHLVRVLEIVHRNEEMDEEDLRERAERMEKSQFQNKLAAALDVRSLTLAVKDVEAKLKSELDLKKDSQKLHEEAEDSRQKLHEEAEDSRQKLHEEAEDSQKLNEEAEELS